MDYIEVEGEKREVIINEDGKAFNGNWGAIAVAAVFVGALGLFGFVEVLKAIF